ncbi:MAG: sigma-54 dependent transcriptional regulator, partial [Candidatus Aenigmatarchaeota archaeon]
MSEIFQGRKILIVDDEEDTLDACCLVLGKLGMQVQTANNANQALRLIRENSFDIVIADIKMPGMDGIELLRNLKKIDPLTRVIMITGYATIESAVESMKAGAFDYISKPFTTEQLRAAVKRALENLDLITENRELRERLRGFEREPVFIAVSEPMKRIQELIKKVAETDSTVLILGETGTGKDLVAKQIHRMSKRSGEPFITVNCAAIPATLLESELFGHEKGAFTGANRKKKGLFELADGGTIFLDEIGDLNIDLQGKLLRAIEEKAIMPLGSERKIHVDVRIIAATNRNLAEAIKQSKFREDLYYRLNVFPIFIPPLRERRDDILPLAAHFLEKYSRKHGKQISGFKKEAQQVLLSYSWPGNVRELENFVERAVILEESETISPESLGDLSKYTTSYNPSFPLSYRERDMEEWPSLDHVEKTYILEVLKATKWNRKKASRILGVSTVTLWRK